MFDGSDLQQARARGGNAAQDRPDEVDEILSPKEKVGWKEELPLLNCNYSDYPDTDELLRPAEGSTLESLVEHDKVRSADDIASELNEDIETVEKAAQLHGVDLPNEEPHEEESRLSELLGSDIPGAMVSPNNPIVVSILYVTYGLSTEEIADLFTENGSNSILERTIRQTLIDAAVIRGETTDDREKRRRRQRGEVTRPSSSGINFDTTKL